MQHDLCNPLVTEYIILSNNLLKIQCNLNIMRIYKIHKNAFYNKHS